LFTRIKTVAVRGPCTAFGALIYRKEAPCLVLGRL